MIEVGDSFLQIACIEIGYTSTVVGNTILRRKVDVPCKISNGLIWIAQVEVDQPSIVVGQSVLRI